MLIMMGIAISLIASHQNRLRRLERKVDQIILDHYKLAPKMTAEISENTSST